MPPLVLASSSPRRRELLALLGVPFAVMPSRYVEPAAPDYPIHLGDFVSELAASKALEVAKRIEAGFVIGADTLVTVDEGDHGTPLGKPTGPEDACRMLGSLSGRTHQVFTAVAIVAAGDRSRQPRPACAVVRTRVTFRELTDTMITDYVSTGEPMDKAGAYGAQGYAAPFILRFEGDFYNVVGLPLCTVATLLEGLGMDWWRYRKQMPRLIG